MPHKPNDGGQAFPVGGISQLPNEMFIEPTCGMTLRDWFASQASEQELVLPDTAKECADSCGVSVNDYVKNRNYWYSIMAKARYQWADAMIAESQRPQVPSTPDPKTAAAPKLYQALKAICDDKKSNISGTNYVEACKALHEAEGGK